MNYQVVSYQTASGERPFDHWLEKLRRRSHLAAAIVDARLARVRDKGNFGDHRSAGHSVYELRIHLGPGYRLYYLLHEQMIVVLLIGGDKKDQQRDIEKARRYAEDFRRRL